MKIHEINDKKKNYKTSLVYRNKITLYSMYT